MMVRGLPFTVSSAFKNGIPAIPRDPNRVFRKGFLLSSIIPIMGISFLIFTLVAGIAGTIYGSVAARRRNPTEQCADASGVNASPARIWFLS